MRTTIYTPGSKVLVNLPVYGKGIQQQEAIIAEVNVTMYTFEYLVYVNGTQITIGYQDIIGLAK